MKKTVLAHHRQPDGALCTYNPKSGVYDQPVEKWMRRARLDWKKKRLEKLERRVLDAAGKSVE